MGLLLREREIERERERERIVQAGYNDFW